MIIADSGMSVSFQSGSAGSAGTVSQESSPQQQVAHGTVRTNIHPSLHQVASSHSRDVLHSHNRNSRKQKTPNQSTHL